MAGGQTCLFSLLRTKVTSQPLGVKMTAFHRHVESLPWVFFPITPHSLPELNIGGCGAAGLSN